MGEGNGRKLLKNGTKADAWQNKCRWEGGTIKIVCGMLFIIRIPE